MKVKITSFFSPLILIDFVLMLTFPFLSFIPSLTITVVLGVSRIYLKSPDNVAKPVIIGI